MKTNPNAPAFARPATIEQGHIECHEQVGMSTRAVIAKDILAAMLSGYLTSSTVAPHPIQVVRDALDYTDTLIRELNK